MKTYPIQRSDGSLQAFEIPNAWFTFRPLYRILRSVEGISDIERTLFNDNRVKFKFHGEQFVINEPWGDNSRYWVGPENAETSNFDITPLHQAFQRHRGTIAKILSWITNAENS